MNPLPPATTAEPEYACALIADTRGWLLLELGYNLEERVREMLGTAWEAVATAADLAGIPRVISARKKP